AANHDAARDVRDAHGGLHFVDVLASFAAGTERVNLQVFGTNVDFDFVIDFGNHEDGGKGGVATRRVIERRNPYQTMNTGFASEQPISVFAGEFNGRRLDAGFFSGHFVEHRSADGFSFSPTQVHAHEHRSPVLRLRAARAGLDGHDGVEMIFFAGKQRFGFQIGNVNIGGAEFAVQLLQQVLFLL